jgi:hypothetical protein
LTIYDGFNPVEFARLDIRLIDAPIERIRLRCGWTICAGLKPAGPTGIATTASGLAVVKQDGIPSHYALVLAVSPFNIPPGGDPHANDVLPKPGDIVLKNDLYAGEPLDLAGSNFVGLGDMERSVSGLLALRIVDIAAIEKRSLPDLQDQLAQS